MPKPGNLPVAPTLSRMTRVHQTGQSGGNTVAPKRVDFEHNAINQFTKVARYKDTAGGSANEVATRNTERGHSTFWAV